MSEIGKKTIGVAFQRRFFHLTTLAVLLLAALLGGCVADVGEYHTYEELDEELNDLANDYPEIARLSSIGKSIEGREIFALKISDNPGESEEEPGVVIFGGHHGREWISVEVPLLIGEYLIENYYLDDEIRDLVDAAEIWVVPLVNPDGHQYSVTTNRFWRKNRRDNGDGTFGVDLNRNYGFEWGGPGSSDDTSSTNYRGTEPFSEPETRAVRDLLNEHPPQAVISYHNYGQLVLYPWGYTKEPAPDRELLDEMGSEIAGQVSSVHSRSYVAEQGSELYLFSGGLMDWAYGEHSIPAFDIELRSEEEPPGFMLPASEIFYSFQENLAGAQYLIEWVALQYELTHGQSNDPV